MHIDSFKNILVISPHPDDSEYSCYGMIKRISADTTILVCSSGGAGDVTNTSDRIGEVINFWKSDGFEVRLIEEKFLEMKYYEAVKYLDDLLNQNNFDAIFIPPEKDTNQEHRYLSEVCKSSLRNKSPALFEYWTPSTTHEWQPNIWLDVGGYFRKKKELLLRVFLSQRSKSYFQESYIDLFHKDWQAFKRNVDECEKYRLISWMCK